MIKVNNAPSRQELMELIESNNRVIDLDPAAVKSGYCEQLRFHNIEAFLSKFNTGKTIEIKNMHAKEGTALRVTELAYAEHDLHGYRTTITLKEDSLALLDTDKGIVYVIGPDDETWFVSTFAKIRGIKLFEIAVHPVYLRENEYIMVSNDLIQDRLERYL